MVSAVTILPDKMHLLYISLVRCSKVPTFWFSRLASSVVPFTRPLAGFHLVGSTNTFTDTSARLWSQVMRKYTGAYPSLFFRLFRMIEVIEKLCFFSIMINFENLKMIWWVVYANYDFDFESWKILVGKMCHKSAWTWVSSKFGEQILSHFAYSPDSSPLFWEKWNVLTIPQRKNPAKSILYWVLASFDMSFREPGWNVFKPVKGGFEVGCYI